MQKLMDYFALFTVLYSQYKYDKYVVNTGTDLIRSNNYILIKN